MSACSSQLGEMLQRPACLPWYQGNLESRAIVSKTISFNIHILVNLNLQPSSEEKKNNPLASSISHSFPPSLSLSFPSSFPPFLHLHLHNGMMKKCQTVVSTIYKLEEMLV